MLKCICLIVVLFAMVSMGQGQDSTGAGRAEVDEKLARLSSDVETLLAANASLQKKMSSLVEENRTLRDEQFKSGHNFATQEDLRRLTEKVQEVDKKREADKQLIIEAIAKMEKNVLGESTSGGKKSGKKTEAPVEPPADQKVHQHTVEKGENLSAIITAYNESYVQKGLKPVTRKQVIDANPGLNPTRLLVGQKIFIPHPTQ